MTTEDIEYISELLRFTEKQIKTRTGLVVRLMTLHPVAPTTTPDMLLKVIANALNIPVQSLRSERRVPEVVEARFIAAVLLRKYFPHIKLREIGRMLGRDHTTVINCIARANELLDMQDERFTKRYNRAHRVVEQYLLDNMKEEAKND